MSPRRSERASRRGSAIWRVPPGRLILASASPRRRHLLELQGLRFDVIPTEIDESALDGEPRWVVRRLALEKAATVQARHPEAWVIGADTVVTLGRRNLGKPADPRDARRILRSLSGRGHTVHTGVAVVGPRFCRARTEATRVRFRRLPEADIRAYVATGEPMDKAGAYALQGQGAVLLASINGDWSNVVGLPLTALRRLLAEAAARTRPA